MASTQLDKLDYRILEMLSGDARRPYLDIARQCNVSGAAIHQHIQKMQKMGVLKGALSIIEPADVGYQTCAYMGFLLSDPSKFNEVIERLKEIPEVVECHFTTGQYDIFIKVYARNNKDLLEIIHSKLQNLVPARTETLISLREVFQRQIPITEP